MNHTQRVVDVNLKNEIQQHLVNKIISGLENKQITLPQMKISANYILDAMPHIQNYSQLIVFLHDLEAKWAIFHDVYNLYKHRFHKEEEQVVMEKLSNYIKNLS